MTFQPTAHRFLRGTMPRPNRTKTFSHISGRLSPPIESFAGGGTKEPSQGQLPWLKAKKDKG